MAHRTALCLLIATVLTACTAQPPVTPVPTLAPGATQPARPTESPHGQAGETSSSASSNTPHDSGAISPTSAPEPSLTPEPPASADLIDAALQEGRLDASTALLYSMFAVFGDPRLPAEFQGVALSEDLSPFLVGSDPHNQLPDDVRAQLEPYLVRPANPDSVFFGADQPVADRPSVFTAARLGTAVAALTCDSNGWASMHAAVRMRIWATCTGSYEAEIAKAVAVANEIYGPEVQYMGGDALPDFGGLTDDVDTSIDVYLTDATACPKGLGRCFVVGADAYGWAMPVAYAGGQGNPSSGYIAVKRDLVLDQPTRFREAMIHELFHVLQYSKETSINFGPTGRTDFSGGQESSEFWFAEASAVWATYHFESQLGHADGAAGVARDWFINGFQNSDVSLDSAAPELQRYEAYIWPFFMNQELGDGIVATIWNALSSETDQQGAMDVISSYLPFYSNFRVFAVRNINFDVSGNGNDPIPKRYKAMEPSIPFPDGHPMGAAWQGPEEIVPTDPDAPIEYPDVIQHLQASYWHMTVRDDVERFEFDFAGLGSSDSLDVDALLGIRTNGPGSALHWEHRMLNDPKQKFCRSVADEDVQEMYLVLSDHEKDPLPLSGTFMVNASTTPCHGFDVTIVHETTGGPWDPSKLTLTAVIEPEEVDGQPTGNIEGYGHAFGSRLHGNIGTGCINDSYDGIDLITAAIQGDQLSVFATAFDPIIAGFFGGLAPLKGGASTVVTPPQLQPGQQQGIPSCEAYSQITDTVTVVPLDPHP